MVARTDLEPAATGDTRSREDVPWRFVPHAWLRRLTFARCLIFVPLAGTLVHRLSVGALTDPTFAFSVLLGCGAAQALAFRFGARRDRGVDAATSILTATFVLDLVLLASLAGATGGIASPFTGALVLPVATAAFVLPRKPSAIATLAAVGALLALATLGPGGSYSERSMHATFALGLVLVASAGAAWAKARLDYLERRAAHAESESGGGSVADWEELGRLESDPKAGASPRGSAEHDDGLAAIAAQISHELRDPAAMIRARAESLRYELRDRTRRDDLLPEIERLLRSADRLEDVRLTLATLGGARGSATSVADPRALLEEIRDAFEGEFERDGVRLRFEAPRALPAVGLTHNELRLILVRWLDASRRAAIAHGRNARIVARFTTAESGVVLEVEDALPLRVAPDCDLGPDHEVERRPGLGLAIAVARLLLVPRGGACETELRRGGGLVLRARLPRVEPSRTPVPGG